MCHCLTNHSHSCQLSVHVTIIYSVGLVSFRLIQAIGTSLLGNLDIGSVFVVSKTSSTDMVNWAFAQICCAEYCCLALDQCL